MKIYFIDGELDQQLAPKDAIFIDASEGYSKSMIALDNLSELKNIRVYTNQVFALQTKYCWDKKKNIPEVYIWNDASKKWRQITKLTARELRYPHNLYNLYMNGEFS